MLISLKRGGNIMPYIIHTVYVIFDIKNDTCDAFRITYYYIIHTHCMLHITCVFHITYFIPEKVTAKTTPPPPPPHRDCQTWMCVRVCERERDL